MNRRQQLRQINTQLLNIFGDDRGAPIIALLDMIAYSLDENDDIIGRQLIITDDIPGPNLDYQMPDVG